MKSGPLLNGSTFRHSRRIARRTAAACVVLTILCADTVNFIVSGASDVLGLPTRDARLEAHRPSDVLKLSPCGVSIHHEVKHSPAFGTLHVKLGPGAQFRAEAGAMVAMQVRASSCVGVAGL